MELIKICDERPNLVNEAIDQLSDPDAKYYAKDVARWVAWELYKTDSSPATVGEDIKEGTIGVVQIIFNFIATAVVICLGIIIWTRFFN